MNDELADAAARYALILSVDANNTDALHRLALIRFRQGRPEEAERGQHYKEKLRSNDHG